MSALGSALAERLTAEHADTAAALAEPPASAATRRRALAALLASGLPTSRDENWKYANLRPLEKLRYLPASIAAPAAAPVTAAALPAALPGHARYVFVDGVLAPALCAPLAATAATLTLRAGAPASPPSTSADERFALLNAAFAVQSIEVRLAASSSAQLELLFVAGSDAAQGACYPRVQLEVEAGARLALVERHLSAAEAPSFVNSAVTVALDAGASLSHYRLQDLSSRSIQLDTLTASLGPRAVYRLHAAATGGQSARSTMKVRLAGERAELAFGMAALGDRHQVQDIYALVEHAAPGARSEQIFRGIAAARSRVAFNGKIVVAAGAHGADSRQSLKGLLAGPDAEIDVRPQLEIYTDDVRCSHGATAGKLDEQMLFYLLSRGLSPQDAQRLLKWAFLGDVIARTDLPALRRQIEARLAGQLRDEALRELTDGS